MGRVDGKVALVTGGAAGIGRSASLLLAREGARVAVTDIGDDDGRIWTPMVEGSLRAAGDEVEGRRALVALHPLGHLGEPDDVGHAIVYLASDESKFVTGSELVVDGGYTAQ